MTVILSPQIRPVHQLPNDLRLCILANDAGADFHILKTQVVAYGDWQFTFAIIGESHVITVRRAGQVILREMLACAYIPQNQCIHNHPFVTGDNHNYADAALRYQINVTFLASEPPPITAKDQIQVAFPEIWGRIPITQIGWQRWRGQHNQAAISTVRWWTLHTYPHRTGSVTYVSTASSLDLTNI